MKGLLSLCFLLGACALVVAELKDKVNEKKVDLAALDKSSDAKPKRDASQFVGSYHGPSYKYLPPSGGASSYDSYAGSHHGSGHSAGFGGGYSSSGIGHSSGYGGGYSGLSSGHHSSGHHGLSSSGLGYAPAGHHGVSSAGLAGGYSGHSLGHSSGHHGTGSSGLGYASSGHYSGHGLAHHSGGGIKGGSHGFSSGPSYSVSSLGHGGYSGTPSYAGHNSYASSGSGSSAGLGYKTHLVSVPSYAVSAGHSGSSLAGATGGYHYNKGSSGSLPSFSSSSGFGAGGFGSSHSLASAGDHHSSDHSDHVHNGEQEHHYVITSGHSNRFGNAHGAATSLSSSGHQGGGYSYEAPIQQHAPASSYGVPINTVGDVYSTNYHSQLGGGQDLAPTYAAGHKGLGHYGFTANKPQGLHTSISGSSFKQTSYAKTPFKPSAFLGAKYEGASDNETPNQQYLPPTGVGADSTGYDYAIPSGPSVVYQEPQYQTNVDVQATPIKEPEANYLPPNNDEASYHEISSTSSGSHFPPSQAYAGPYSH